MKCKMMKKKTRTIDFVLILIFLEIDLQKTFET